MTEHLWTTRGFDAFRRGRFGNAGQNIYVSRNGVLQRIHLFDINADGWIDLLLCNAQEHWEEPPTYLYVDPLGDPRRIDLPAEGAACGAVADLNADGLDDIVLGMERSGRTTLLNARVYFSAARGPSLKHHTQLPAPSCTDLAAGDFNGDGKVDLAFVCEGKLRVFYQTNVGFEPWRFVTPGIDGGQVAAGDFDGDGFADLYVIGADGHARVYWGGPEGLKAERCSVLPHRAAPPAERAELVSDGERIGDISPRAGTVVIGGVTHLFVPQALRALLAPVGQDRSFGPALALPCRWPMAIAAGDIKGNGQLDLVIAACDDTPGTPGISGSGVKECSWVYWGSPEGYSVDRRTALPTRSACDVAVGDLDADGCADIVIAIHRTAESYSTDSLIYRGTRAGVDLNPVRLATGGARRVFIVRALDHPRPQVVFVNQFLRSALGKINPVIYWGSPDGFSADRKRELPGFGTVNGICADFNDDGRPDLLLVNCAENAVHLDPGSFVMLADERGLPAEPSQVIPTKSAMAACVADLDGDGYLDLIFSRFGKNEWLIFRGGEKGFDTASPRRILIEEEGVKYVDGRRMCLADLNNDGRLDLVVTDCRADRSFILWGGPDGFSASRKQPLAVLRASAPCAADLTGNGYLDLIIAGHTPRPDHPDEGFVYIYYNGPEGIREDRRTQLPANTVLGVAVADFNNDGALDLFVTNYHDGRMRDIDSYLYWGATDGTFALDRRTDLATHSAAGCLAADFNEDGFIDLAIANHKTLSDHVGASDIWWNGPGGFDPRKVSKLPSSGPHGIMFTQPGNQRDRGPEEYYESEPYQPPEGARFDSVEWDATLGPKTWVKAMVRLAAGREELEHAPWRDPREVRRQPAPWMQYRLALGATNSGSTPRLTEVRVRFE